MTLFFSIKINLSVLLTILKKWKTFSYKVLSKNLNSRLNSFFKGANGEGRRHLVADFQAKNPVKYARKIARFLFGALLETHVLEESAKTKRRALDIETVRLLKNAVRAKYPMSEAKFDAQWLALNLNCFDY